MSCIKLSSFYYTIKKKKKRYLSIDKLECIPYIFILNIKNAKEI